MKKICVFLFVFLTCFILTGCKDNAVENKPNTKVGVNDEYIEEIPNNAIRFIENLENDSVLLTGEQIKEYNKNIMSKTDSMHDLNNINFTKEEVIKLINSYKMPSLPKYNGSVQVTNNDIKTILDNRNIDGISEDKIIKKAIIVKRSDLKSYPTDIKFLTRKNSNNFDQLQETELTINTPILVVHESKDKLWSFVISEIYYGWIKNETFAYSLDEDISYFIDNPSFGVITDSKLELDDVILDMGVKLPYLGVVDDSYEFSIPIKNDDGYVSRKTIKIPRNKAHIGYLPYTKRNVIIQAFKYEGVNYGWAGMNNSVDCSSYVLNIYRTFGFSFPRNTVDQRDSVGNITWLNNKTNSEKLNILSNNKVSLIYQPGHVMLYLGVLDNKHYIIHSSGDELKVVVTNLDENSKYLTKIDRMVTIP